MGSVFGSWVTAWVWWLWFLAVTGVFGCGFWLWLWFLVVFGVGPVFLVVVVVFVLKGVVGHGWVWGLGCGWVVGPMFGSWVTAWVSGGCGFWL